MSDDHAPPAEPPAKTNAKSEQPGETGHAAQTRSGETRSHAGSTDWLAFFTGFRGLVALLIVAIVGVLMLFPALPARVYFFFKPPSAQLFVDSPEIYTRERLINDRLQESIWLRRQLTAIEKTDSFVRAVDTTRTDFSIASQAGKTDADTQSEAAPPSREATDGPESGDSNIRNLFLTFDQQFELNSYYRSLVRQKILENSLDDRHDLLGNSLYILKFDTTMVSVPAAGQRGRVTVRVLPPSPLDNLEFTRSDFSNLLDVLKGDDVTLKSITASFAKWIESTEYLLNTLLAERYNRLVRSGDPRLLEELEDYLSRFTQGPPPARTSDATTEVQLRNLVQAYPVLSAFFIARKVLAENYRTGEDRIKVPTLEQVGVSPPGVQLYTVTVDEVDNIVAFYLRVGGERGPFAPPTIDVSARSLSGYIVHRDCLNNITARDIGSFIGIKAYDDPSMFIPLYGVDNEHTLFGADLNIDSDMRDWILDSVALEDDNLVQYIFQKNSFASGLRDRIVYNTQGIVRQSIEDPAKADKIRAIAGELDACLAANGDRTIYSVYIGTGLVNYIEKIKHFSTYGYTVLPRENPVAIMRDILTVNRFIQTTGTTRLSGLAERHRQGVDLRQVLTTFGDLQLRPPDEPSPDSEGDSAPGGGAEREWEPVVGWILDPGAGQILSEGLNHASTSESVLAIISAPAWWTEVNLEVGIEVLERWDAQGSAAGSQTKRFKVQLPYHADSIDTLLIEDTRRGPVISDVECTAVPASPTPDDESEAAPSVRVMIRGRHLWRNTVVTLGGLRADAIEVLPNMKGILARFPGTGPDHGDLSGVLRVWTSEGVAEPPSGRMVTIRSGNKECSLDDSGAATAAPGGPDDYALPASAN